MHEFTPEYLLKVDEWTRKSHREATKANDDYEILKEIGKDILADLMTKEEKACGLEKKTSEVQLERLARGTKEWKEHREAYYQAKKLAGELNVKAKSFQRLWETIQSGMSYKKMEIQRIQSHV